MGDKATKELKEAWNELLDAIDEATGISDILRKVEKWLIKVSTQ